MSIKTFILNFYVFDSRFQRHTHWCVHVLRFNLTFSESKSIVNNLIIRKSEKFPFLEINPFSSTKD